MPRKRKSTKVHKKVKKEKPKSSPKGKRKHRKHKKKPLYEFEQSDSDIYSSNTFNKSLVSRKFKYRMKVRLFLTKIPLKQNIYFLF